MTQATWLGHPRGLATLFMTEFFERFTYYGMRALLILFMTAAAANGGLGIDPRTAGAIYGLYTGSVFLFSLPGGWIADRLVGPRNAVFYGGVLITIGNFILALPGVTTFYTGLLVIVLGVGLLKPNISAMVGQLYEHESGARRDAGFSIFYMGINFGAFVAPLIAGTLGEVVGYRWGFASAGVAMALGVVQYKMTERHLYQAGTTFTAVTPAERKAGWNKVIIGLVVLVAGFAAALAGLFPVSVVRVAEALGVLMVALAVAFFGGVLLFGGLTREEKGRVGVIAIFFVCAALFWAGFEQQGSTFNLFARDYTDRSWLGSWFGEAGVHPASWYQSINPVLIIIMAPMFAWVWIALGKRNLDPSAPAKFGIGLILLGAGFAVMILAADLIIRGGVGTKVLPSWLIFAFFLHTVGELFLSPVGLSNVTKLSPKRYVGQMMGTWFLGSAVGNLAAGLIGGHVGASGAEAMPGQFTNMVIMGVGAGLLMIAASPVIRKMMGGVK